MKVLKTIPAARECLNYVPPDKGRHFKQDRSQSPFEKYKAAWRLIRARAFEKHGKLCSFCLLTGKAVKFGTVVDHKTEWRRPDGSISKRLFLKPLRDINAVQILCLQCHARKSQRARARYARARARA